MEQETNLSEAERKRLQICTLSHMYGRPYNEEVEIFLERHKDDLLIGCKAKLGSVASSIMRDLRLAATAETSSGNPTFVPDIVR